MGLEMPSPAAATAAVAVSAEASYATSTNCGASDLAGSSPVKSEVTDSGRNSNANPSPSYASVKLECERALTALRSGNHTGALRLMKDLLSKHENSPHSALIHRVQGTVLVKVASITDGTNAKQRHLRNAIDSARTAATLSPNSIEFGHFYANLMYEAANEAGEFEEVVRECERALKICTTDARVANVQNELRSLIQKSNTACFSAWMKNISNGEVKFPIRRVPKDPVEQGLVQARRPNEIKKVAKTPEERRKEIEARVTAARFLRQNSESAPLKKEGDNAKNNSKGTEYGAGSGSRVGEILKSGNVRKKASSDERRDLVRTFWNSMKLDGKKELLRIKISDLRAHFSSSKDGLPSEVLDEALSFGETNKAWRFWACCRCNEKFVDAGLLIQHVGQEHMGSLLPKMQSILPENVENEWAEMLLNCSWKPLDLNAAIRMLQKQSKPDSPDLLDESCARDNALDQSSEGSLLHKSWPLSDDAERAKILERIRSIFEVLIRHKCMASSHLSKIMHFAVEKLHAIPCGSQLNTKVGQTPLIICFLGASDLKKIMKLLEEISQSCGLNRYSDKSNMVEKINTTMHAVDTFEKIAFSSDASFLVLDEHFLPCKIPRDGAVNNVSSALTSSHDSCENGDILDSDALLSWIVTGVSSGDQLASWQHQRAEKTQQGVEILQLLEKESNHLQSLCERKCEHISYEGALQAVRDLCLEEGKKRENVADFVFHSYDSVLKKRREELIENENDLTIISSRFELEAISNVLCDLKSVEDDKWRTKDTMQQVDSYIEAAIQRQKEQVSIEISKIDARLMRVIADMQQLKVKLDPASSHDYRSILIPLVKSFMRARVENLAEKDAAEKSDAVRKAFLAALSRNSKKVSAGVDSSRHVHDGTKDVENRKNRDSKVADSDELQDQTAEEILLPSAHEEDGPASGIDVPAPHDALQLKYEEYKQQN